MSKHAVIDQSSAQELDELKGRIADYDREFHSAFQRQMGYAFLAGVALLRAKEIIPHGRFLEWREAELEVKRSSAERYMKFAEALGKFPTVGNLREVKLISEGEPLTPEQQQRVADAVHKIADGKTLTEMYRDLGVIRQPQKPKHHPRKAGPADAAAQLKAEREWSARMTETWKAPLRIWIDTHSDAEGRRVDLDAPDYQAALDLLTEATALCRAKIKALK